MTNQIGPQIPPGGTPIFIDFALEMLWLIFVLCVQSAKYERNKVCHKPLTPWYSSFSSGMSCLTLSKALAKNFSLVALILIF